jgi:hypothetical protein
MQTDSSLSVKVTTSLKCMDYGAQNGTFIIN